MQPYYNLLGVYSNKVWSYTDFSDGEINRLGWQMKFHLYCPKNCIYFRRTTLEPSSELLFGKEDRKNN